MPPKYTPPSPAEFASLSRIPCLAGEEQQAALAAYASGEIGIENTVYQVLMAVQAQHPALQKALDAAATERAIRAQEEKEMAENANATGPTFVDYGLDGKPLSKLADPEPPEEPAEAPVTEEAPKTAPPTTQPSSPMASEAEPEMEPEMEPELTRIKSEEVVSEDSGFVSDHDHETDPDLYDM